MVLKTNIYLMKSKQSRIFKLQHTTESDRLNSAVLLDVMASCESKSESAIIVSRTVRKPKNKYKKKNQKISSNSVIQFLNTVVKYATNLV